MRTYPQPFAALAASAALMTSACASERPVATTDGPVVERSTVDGVETVRNISGSEWGEVGLSLIVEIGGDESEDYMFARPMGIWATDAAVYVADMNLGLRSYTRDGEFIRQYGRQGEGPGEYSELFSTAVLADGRVVAQGFEKLVFYQQDGTFDEEWRIQPVTDGYTIQGGPFVVTAEGRMFLRVRRRIEGATDPREAQGGYVQAGPEGWVGEFLMMQRPEVDRSPIMVPCPGGRGACFLSIPYRPGGVVMLTPQLKLASGVTDRYRFRVESRDGSVMVIERFEEPVALTDLERRYHEAAIEARARRSVPGYELDTNLFPAVKPAFILLLATQDGRILAVREGGSRWKTEECGSHDDWVPDEGRNDCLEAQIFVDIFAGDGRYLGYFERPSDVRLPYAHFNGNEMWTYALGADGNSVVRGYELIIPTDS